MFNIIHLIYRAKPYEEQFKDYAFGTTAMREHWTGGFEDMTRSSQGRNFSCHHRVQSAW